MSRIGRARRAARHARMLAGAALALGLASCTSAPRSPEWAGVREATPAFLVGRDASDPSVAAAGPRVALTWVTRDPAGGADVWVSVSADSGARFSPPARVNARPGGVSSYAESPPVAAWSPDGALVVAWATKRDSSADDIAARASADGGRSWSAEALVNDDAGDPRSRYHGFVSLAALPGGRLLAAWIDGRGAQAEDDGEPHTAQVRLAASGDGGATWGASTLVATEACPCCKPALRAAGGAPGGATVAIAYRGARGELRDPRLAISRDGGVTFATDTLVSNDRWWLTGCPSTGPALAFQRSDGGHVAWFTGPSPRDGELGARPASGVYVAAWRAGAGAADAPQALADSIAEPGRPVIAELGDAALVGVIARTREIPPRRVLAVRSLGRDGARTPWLFLGAGARNGSLAGAGPRAAWAAWVEGSREAPRVRLARIVPR